MDNLNFLSAIQKKKKQLTKPPYQSIQESIFSAPRNVSSSGGDCFIGGAAFAQQEFESHFQGPNAAIKWGKKNSDFRIAVVVPNERSSKKLMPYADIMRGENVYLQALNLKDLENGVLDSFHVVVIPGGPVIQYDRQLGASGSKILCDFVSGGKSYFGICAGAFLACREGYQDCAPDFRICGASSQWVSGEGSGIIQFTDVCPFEVQSSNATVEWNNGCVMTQTSRADLPEAEILAFQQSITIDGKTAEFENTAAAMLTTFGSGSVIAIGPHPETHLSDPTARDFVRQSLLWLADQAST